MEPAPEAKHDLPAGQEHLVVIDYLFILLRQWKFVVVGLAVGLIVGLIIYKKSAPVYESTSTLLIEISNTPLSGESKRATYEPGRDWLTTEISLMRSDRVLGEAVKMLKGQYSITLEEMRNGVLVSAEKYTNLVTIGFRCNNPKEAADVVSAITKAYEEHFRQRMQNYTSRQLDWLQKHMPGLETDLAEAQRKRIEFQKTLGMLSFGAGEKSEPEEVVVVRELKKEAADLDAQLADYRSRIGALKKLGNDTGAAFSLTWFRTDPVIAGLLQHEKELSENLAAMLSRLGPKHQDVVETEARLQQINAEKTKAFTELSHALDAQHEALTLKLEDTRKRLLEAETKANDLAAKLAELENLQRLEDDARDRHSKMLKQYSEMNLTSTFEAGRVDVVKPAMEALEPLWPNLVKVMAAALILGLLGGVFAGFFWESLDDSVRSGEDVNYIWRMPVLGLIPHVDEQPTAELGREMLAGHRTEVEAFRMLAISLDLVISRYPRKEGEARVVMISSAGPREGKSFISFYLGLTLAMANKKVLAIDADLRRRGFTKLAGLSDAKGLSHWFRNGGPVENFLSKLPSNEPENLDVLAAGHWDKSPTLMLRQHALDVLVEQMKSKYDYILIDVPPLSFVSDALVITRLQPLVLMVTRMGVTSKRLLRRSRDIIHTAGLTPIGSVINEFNAPGVRYGYYYRYYGYYYPYTSAYYYPDNEEEEEDGNGGTSRSKGGDNR